MKLVHVASISNNPFNGVCVAVPQHIMHQQTIAEVALLNIMDCHIDGVINQFVYKNGGLDKNVPLNFSSPDLVIFHEVYHYSFIKISRELLHKNIPYVIIPHGCLVYSAQHKRWIKKTIANLLFFNSFIQSSVAVQCLSENEYNNTFFNVKKFIGTNGIDIERKGKKEFRNNRLQFVYIGRLEVEPKGLDLLIKSISELQDYLRDKQVLFNLYGPDLYNRLAAVKGLIDEEGVNDLVILHPPVLGDDKIKCLLNSDIFIQTSRHEGMPMGILEAMAYGVPVVITKGTSLGRITSKYDAGWVSENSVESISCSIRKAIEERDQLYTKSSNAIRLVSENYSWETISKETINQYELISQF